MGDEEDRESGRGQKGPEEVLRKVREVQVQTASVRRVRIGQVELEERMALAEYDSRMTDWRWVEPGWKECIESLEEARTQEQALAVPAGCVAEVVLAERMLQTGH
jgi:protoheme ferro-lyase